MLARIFLSLFLLSALWWSLGFPSELVQIGTFNLDFFTDLNPSTGKWCEEHNPRSLQEIKALAQFIDSLDIEVLALQEVEDAAAMDLLLRFMPPGKYAYVMLPQTHPQTCQRIAVLYQEEEVEIRFVGTIPLSLNHYGLRDGLVVQGKFLPDGFDFTMVVVHLKAFFDPRSQGIRKRQLSLLGQWVKDYLSNSGNDPDLILVGDFNEHLLTNTEAFSLIDQGEGLYDVLRDAPDTTCTPLSHYWADPIDHILISKDARNEYAGTAEVDNFFTDSSLPYRYSYSDHCVVWADFKDEDADSPQLTGSHNQASIPSQTSSAGTCAVTVTLESVDLVYNNHVGNDWTLELFVNDQQVPVYQFGIPKVVWTTTFSGAVTVTVTARAIEEDKYPDIGFTTKTFTIACPSYPQEATLEVLVRENRGRYAGNTALWRFQIRVETSQ